MVVFPLSGILVGIVRMNVGPDDVRSGTGERGCGGAGDILGPVYLILEGFRVYFE